MVQPRVTEDILYKYITEEEVFKALIPQFKIVGRKFNADDSDADPSAGIFKASNGRLLYKNFATGACLNPVTYAMRLYGLNYGEALFRIANLFNFYGKMVDMPPVVEAPKTVLVEKRREDLRVKRRPFDFKDIAYWKSYGISVETLQLYQVSAISYYWYKQDKYIPTTPAFCYYFPDDGLYSYKLYFPFNKGTGKSRFLSSASSRAVQGLSQLKNSTDLLIITKSLKDVMLLHEYGIRAIAPQSENTYIPKDIAFEIMTLNKPVVAFDNDYPGKRATIRMLKYLGLDKSSALLLPESYRIQGVKDISDMYFHLGNDCTRAYIDKLYADYLYDSTKSTNKKANS